MPPWLFKSLPSQFLVGFSTEAFGYYALAQIYGTNAGTGVLGLSYGQGLASFVVFTLLTVRFVRFLPPAYDIRILMDSLRLSAPLTPRIFFGIIGTQTDKYLLALLSSVGGVGVYSVGQRLASVAFTT